ncbi:MAG: hypothetical protein IT565_09535 [Rhodospirillales bacterium]|nr:hypothetical protein [Rhodospirillales bacterium]
MASPGDFIIDIERDLGDNPGKVRFSKVSEFWEWLSIEYRFLEGINNKTGGFSEAWKQIWGNAFNEIRSYLLLGHTRVNDITSPKDIDGILQNFAERRCIHSDSNLGNAIAMSAMKNPIDGACLLLASSNIKVSIPIRNGDFDIGPLLRASQISFNSALIDINYLFNNSNKINNNLSSLQLEYQNGINELANVNNKQNIMLEELVERNRKFIGDLETNSAQAINRLINEIQNKSNAIVTFESIDKTLDATKKYWNNKKDVHSNIVSASGWILFLVASFVVLLYLNVGDSIIESIPSQSPGVLFDPVRAIYALAPIIIAFWGLRIIVRIFFKNIFEEADAHERVTMLSTYLLMIKNDLVSKDEDRALILRALFRNGPGVGAKDEDETSIKTFFDALIKRINK